jgi:hypothetical protein
VSSHCQPMSVSTRILTPIPPYKNRYLSLCLHPTALFLAERLHAEQPTGPSFHSSDRSNPSTTSTPLYSPHSFPHKNRGAPAAGGPVPLGPGRAQGGGLPPPGPGRTGDAVRVDVCAKPIHLSVCLSDQPATASPKPYPGTSTRTAAWRWTGCQRRRRRCSPWMRGWGP